MASKTSPAAVTMACHTAGSSPVRTVAVIAPSGPRNSKAWRTSSSMATVFGSASSGTGIAVSSIRTFSGCSTTTGQG